MRFFARKKKVRQINIVDAGSDRRPSALVKRAIESNEKKRGRFFTAIEKIAFEHEELKRELGITHLPQNVALLNKDALIQIKKFKPKSQNIIFASYLLNNIIGRKGGLLDTINFIHYSMRALKPNGRLILIQDRIAVEDYRSIAKTLGLKTHIIPMTDKQAQEANAWAIEMRSTPKKRVSYITGQGKEHTIEYYRELAEKKGYKEPDELVRPVIIIIKKPFNETLLQKALRQLTFQALNESKKIRGL